jgi:hypothetical protein
MRTVRVAETFAVTVHEAETAWYDTTRWSNWVDGLERVLDVRGEWPQQGMVTWQSGPAGRGHVTERVVAHEALRGQALQVEDDSIRGHQHVSFTPVDGAVEITLSLEYEIKERSIVTPLVDVLFIRRAIATSLRRTLDRFGAELAAARRADVG